METLNRQDQTMVHLTINNIPCCAPAGSTILEAAHAAGIAIPTLCYLKEVNEIGACRMCVVEVRGARNLVPACVHPIAEGMEVFTNTKNVQAARRTNLKLLLSIHNQDCLSCPRSGDCELQKLCREYGVDNHMAFEGEKNHYEIDTTTPHLIRDNSKCILCRRCVATCEKVMGVEAIGVSQRGFKTHIGPSFDAMLNQTACINCGQCIVACPTGALTTTVETDTVWAAIDDPTKHVIIQTAPSVRATLGECFGLPVGTNVEGKMVAALRRLGFDGVFDTDFAADMTIMEEATEFLHRFESGQRLPLFTSCCPGWVKYCEEFYPEFLPNLSTCKSPQQMFGALAKTYYAQKKGIDPKDIVCVSVMPCTAKKFEHKRGDQSAAGEEIRDVDVALTTRALGHMIKRAGLLFDQMPDEQFDSALGIASGASYIFGVTGGVMEAALRTAAEVLTGKPLADPVFQDIRGTDQGIKEAEYQLVGKKIRVCCVCGIGNAATVLEWIKSGEKQYDFVEVMACPGGCINGGGQPTQPAEVRNFWNLKALRAKALYDEDEATVLRKSHENPLVQRVYEEFLGQPGSEKAHHILHTSYVERDYEY